MTAASAHRSFISFIFKIPSSGMKLEYRDNFRPSYYDFSHWQFIKLLSLIYELPDILTFNTYLRLLKW